jgi:prolyl 4-hydroxylase
MNDTSELKLEKNNYINEYNVSLKDTPCSIKMNDNYQYIDLNYPGIKIIHNHLHIPIYTIDDFLDNNLCELLISLVDPYMLPSTVVGDGGNRVISKNRSSSTIYLKKTDLPTITKKICKLLNKELDHLELPQVARYNMQQEYKPHYDAFKIEDKLIYTKNGGQRIATVLIYLKDVNDGGETDFPKLNIKIKPRKGTALVFFPATTDGKLDENALHSALPAKKDNEKYIVQIWVRECIFNGIHDIELTEKI